MSKAVSRDHSQLDATTRAAVRAAARQAGKSLRQWLDDAIRTKAFEDSAVVAHPEAKERDHRLAEITRRLAENANASRADAHLYAVNKPAALRHSISSPAPKIRLNAKEQRLLLQQSLDAINQQLDLNPQKKQLDVTEARQIAGLLRLLQKETSDLRHMLSAITPRAATAPLQNILDELNAKILDQRQNGISDDVLAAARRLSSDLPQRIKNLDAAPVLAHLRSSIDAIEQRLARFSATDALQLSVIEKIGSQIAVIHDQLKEIADNPLPIEKIESRLNTLTCQIGDIAQKHGRVNSISQIEAAVEKINSIVAATTHDSLTGFNHELETINSHIDSLNNALRQHVSQYEKRSASLEQLITLLHQKIEKTLEENRLVSPEELAPSSHQEILAQLQNIQERIVKKSEEASQADSHHARLTDMVENLSRLIQTKLTHDGVTPAVKAVEEQVETLSRRLDSTESTLNLMSNLDARIDSLGAKIETGCLQTSQAAKESLQSVNEKLTQVNNRLYEFEQTFQRLTAHVQAPRLSAQETAPLHPAQSFETTGKAPLISCELENDASSQQPAQETRAQTLSIKREFIAAARRSAQRLRAEDPSALPLPQVADPQIKTLLNALNARRHTVLLGAGVFVFIVASFHFLDHMKFELTQTKHLIRLAAASPEALRKTNAPHEELKTASISTPHAIDAAPSLFLASPASADMTDKAVSSLENASFYGQLTMNGR